MKNIIQTIKYSSNKIGSAIAGPKDEYSLEKRLMNLVSFVALIAAFIITILNFAIKLPIFVSIQTLFALIIFIPIYYQMRFKENHKYYYGILMLVILTSFMIGFLYNWGTQGGTIFYFLIFIMLLSIYQNKKFQNTLFIISFFIISGLFIFEYYFPNSIQNPYKNNLQRSLDIYLAVSFSFISIIYFIRSISNNYKYERKKVEQQNSRIEQMLEQEKKESAAKINFFTNISHELRSPLSLIVAPLEKLMETDRDKERLTQYQLIRDNARKMNLLVDQILDFRKLEMGSMELKKNRVEFIDYMLNLKLSYSALAERNMVNLIFQPNIPKTMVNIDYEKFERAISNILNNAFKFTKNGDSIYITLEKSKSDNNKVQLIIKDTGIGIPNDIIQNIFKPFYQSPDTQYGTGLGLPIAQEIIKHHNGSIKVESTEGKGTCFTVELPIDDNQEINDSEVYQKNVRVADLSQNINKTKAINKENGKNEEPKQNSPKVLLVEDNLDIIDFLSESLGDEFLIIKSHNGLQGLSLAQSEMPDLIISDIMMPEMNGLELCHKIKSNDLTSHIPVILLTAKSTDEEKIEGLETGADDYIKKPFNIKELNARAINLIESRKKLRERFKKELYTITPQEISPTSSDKRFMQKAIEIVKANIHNKDFKAAEFVDEMGMSRTSLHSKLKQLTNLSTSQFLIALRLKRAAEIIKTENKTISEVSYEVGFESPAYFSKKFKEYFGKLPSEY